MSFKCPYTEECHALAMQELKDVPIFIALIQERTQCNEQNPARAERCAIRLGLTTAPLQVPLGTYIQSERRRQSIPQSTFAKQVGISITDIRELELNKLDQKKITPSLLSSVAEALSLSFDYLKSLISTASTPTYRQGTSFARTIIPDDDKDKP